LCPEQKVSDWQMNMSKKYKSDMYIKRFARNNEGLGRVFLFAQSNVTADNKST